MGRIIVLRVYSSCFPSFFIIKTQKKHAWVYIYIYMYMQLDPFYTVASFDILRSRSRSRQRIYNRVI